jgi:hypothetical protein
MDVAADGERLRAEPFVELGGLAAFVEDAAPNAPPCAKLPTPRATTQPG